MSSSSLSALRARPLAHRLLFPALPADAPLPPLVASPELTTELYDIIALSLRAYVVPWWSKISRYDKQFLPQITRILTTVIHHLDSRIRAAPHASLVFTHLPLIVTQHYRDYRNVQSKLGTSYATGAAASLPELFHHLQPHIAISADGRIDPEYLRQLIDHILKVSLPPEDYQPDIERFIVREVLLKVVINDILPKVSQPWFIQRIILDLLHFEDQLPAHHSPTPQFESSISFDAILVVFFSAIQNTSGACLSLVHGYKHVVHTIKHVTQLQTASPPVYQPQNLMHPLLGLLSEIFTLQERVTSAFLLSIVHVFVGFTTSFLNRLLPYLLASFLSPSFILSVARTTKRNLFPNGYPGPTPVEPSPEEQLEIYSRLSRWRPTGVFTNQLLSLILGPDPTRALEDAIIPLSNAPCNMHLILFTLDCLIITLFPEISITPSAIGRKPAD